MSKKATLALDIAAAVLAKSQELQRMSGWDWSHLRLFFCISLQV